MYAGEVNVAQVRIDSSRLMATIISISLSGSVTSFLEDRREVEDQGPRRGRARKGG